VYDFGRFADSALSIHSNWYRFGRRQGCEDGPDFLQAVPGGEEDRRMLVRGIADADAILELIIALVGSTDHSGMEAPVAHFHFDPGQGRRRVIGEADLLAQGIEAVHFFFVLIGAGQGGGLQSVALRDGIREHNPFNFAQSGPERLAGQLGKICQQSAFGTVEHAFGGNNLEAAAVGNEQSSERRVLSLCNSDWAGLV